MTEFFRHRPECGRRFHIKLENKKLLSEHRESMPGRKVLRSAVARSGSMGSGASLAPSITPLAVQEGKPIIVDIEEFQYAYKCNHCGHAWTETHLASRREG